MDSRIIDFAVFMDAKKHLLLRLSEAQPLIENFSRAMAKASLEVSAFARDPHITPSSQDASRQKEQENRASSFKPQSIGLRDYVLATRRYLEKVMGL